MLIAFKMIFLKIFYLFLWSQIIVYLISVFILKILGPFLLLRAHKAHLTVDVTFLPVHFMFVLVRLLSSLHSFENITLICWCCLNQIIFKFGASFSLPCVPSAACWPCFSETLYCLQSSKWERNLGFQWMKKSFPIPWGVEER